MLLLSPCDRGVCVCAELVERERRFLLSLERNIRRSSATSSDAEDISEELNVSHLLHTLEPKADDPSHVP